MFSKSLQKKPLNSPRTETLKTNLKPLLHLPSRPTIVYAPSGSRAMEFLIPLMEELKKIGYGAFVDTSKLQKLTKDEIESKTEMYDFIINQFNMLGYNMHPNEVDSYVKDIIEGYFANKDFAKKEEFLNKFKYFITHYPETIAVQSFLNFMERLQIKTYHLPLAEISTEMMKGKELANNLLSTKQSAVVKTDLATALHTQLHIPSTLGPAFYFLNIFSKKSGDEQIRDRNCPLRNAFFVSPGNTGEVIDVILASVLEKTKQIEKLKQKALRINEKAAISLFKPTGKTETPPRENYFSITQNKR